MIFVVDPEGNVGQGESFREALKEYDHEHGGFSLDELRVFEGVEMSVTMHLSPKKGK